MLPEHGWIRCRRCFTSKGDELYLGQGSPAPWRLEATSAAWGTSNPRVMVLGFSKGAHQSKPLPFEEVPFAGMWPQMTRVLQALRLLGSDDRVERHFGPDEPDLHFGSLIRCSVARWDRRKQDYGKSGGQILAGFLRDSACHRASRTCARTYLGTLPERTRLVLMLGNADQYVERCITLMKQGHPAIQRLNAVSYGTDSVTWVHALHPKAQGAHLSNWLAGNGTAIGRKFAPAMKGVLHSGAIQWATADGCTPSPGDSCAELAQDQLGRGSVPGYKNQDMNTEGGYMLKQTIDRLTAEFGSTRKPTKKMQRWEPRLDTGIGVEGEGVKRRGFAQVWVPHPGAGAVIPANAVEYGASEGRHSNAYSMPGLKKGMPALRIKVETPAQLEELVRFIRGLPPIRSVA